MKKPKKLSYAIYLLIASFIIGILNVVIVHNMAFNLKEIFILIMTYSTMLLFIYFINAGKKWARTIFSILLVIGLVIFSLRLISTFKSYSVAEGIAIIMSILQIVAVILMYNKDVNNWFHSKKTNSDS